MAIFSTTTKISLLFLFLFVSSSPFVNGNTTLKSAGECSDVIQNAVGECLAFVTLVSEVDEPEAMCCLGFKQVMDTGCLCRWFKDMGSLGFTFNVTKAYSLPYACKLVDPSMASCGLSMLSPPPPPPPPPPSHAPATTPQIVNCTRVIPNILAKCLPFAIASQADRPEAKCCLAVKIEMLKGCLCEEFKDNVYMGFKVNVTKASTLPDACNLVDPSMASCGLSPPSPPPPAIPPPPPATSASASAPAPAAGSRPGSDSAPTPSQRNHGSSLTPISTLSFVTTGALVMLCFI